MIKTHNSGASLWWVGGGGGIGRGGGRDGFLCRARITIIVI